MKRWFSEQEARGNCAACGRALCHQHAHVHDEMTLGKSDTSTGYASYYNLYRGAEVLRVRDSGLRHFLNGHKLRVLPSRRALQKALVQ